MQFEQNVSLSKYSTMKLGGKAAYLADVNSVAELIESVSWAKTKKLKIIMIGGGSNIFWKDNGFDGVVLVNKIKGYESNLTEDGKYNLTVGAGENWDSVVKRTVDAGITGIECLSLIPGTVGATPIQNVGAYGQEISQVLMSVEAYDLNLNKIVTIKAANCDFEYRSSRFKTTDNGRFLITNIKLLLKHGNPNPPFYPILDRYLTENNINEISPRTIRQAVIHIRQEKLPDPAVVANNGSFFANPIIESSKFNDLKFKYPKIAYWPIRDHKVKISAAWLVETAGFANYHDEDTGMATWPKQCLVLVNEHAKSTADLLKFREKIERAVWDITGIKLEQEPELLPR